MSKRLSATMSMRRSSTRRCASVSLSNTSRTVSGPNERLPAPIRATMIGSMHHAPSFQIDSDLCGEFPITSVGLCRGAARFLPVVGNSSVGLPDHLLRVRLIACPSHKQLPADRKHDWADE